MTTLGLYDVLVGGFISHGDKPRPDLANFKGMSDAERLRRSIIENLTMVLKTPRGPKAAEGLSEPAQCWPHFGVPDLMQIYYEGDASLDKLRDEIKRLILDYEPRISKVWVKEPQYDRENMRIKLPIEILVRDSSQREFMTTEFSTTGWSKIEFHDGKK